MGKQTAIALTSADERAFLTFLRSIAEVKLFVSSAPTVDSLWVDSFDCGEGHTMFYVWNTAFAWSPEYGTVTADRSGTTNGHWFVSNKDAAPLLEYSRHSFQHSRGGGRGRLYWSKYFSGIPAYDVLAFERWYSTVVRWLKKDAVYDRKAAVWVKRTSLETWGAYRAAEEKELEELVARNRKYCIEVLGGRPARKDEG
ncbi:MAG: hypothetical protein C5B50_09760 [Verrucomicrobia bacterium]|nr:MAG: hypothetical protein C5B50_09760 [Verrucomicrobiota bacterium]